MLIQIITEAVQLTGHQPIITLLHKAQAIIQIIQNQNQIQAITVQEAVLTDHHIKVPIEAATQVLQETAIAAIQTEAQIAVVLIDHLVIQIEAVILTDHHPEPQIEAVALTGRLPEVQIEVVHHTSLLAVAQVEVLHHHTDLAEAQIAQVEVLEAAKALEVVEVEEDNRNDMLL